MTKWKLSITLNGKAILSHYLYIARPLTIFGDFLRNFGCSPCDWEWQCGRGCSRQSCPLFSIHPTPPPHNSVLQNTFMERGSQIDIIFWFLEYQPASGWVNYNFCSQQLKRGILCLKLSCPEILLSLQDLFRGISIRLWIIIRNQLSINYDVTKSLGALRGPGLDF